MSAPRLLLVTIGLLLASPSMYAHYHMLLPAKSSAKTDEEVTFEYRFGHPFEHQMFACLKPSELYVIAPDGTKTDLLSKLVEIKIEGEDGKKVLAYSFSFTPTKRGDYTFVAVAPSTKVDGEPLPLKDVIKVVLHVQTQNGWDRRAVTAKTAMIETSPLTRPYAIVAGSAFQIEADEPAEGERKALAGMTVEVERYNAAPPKVLPADEFITRTARTTRAGSATVTLPDAGWWAITCIRDTKEQRHRCTLWVEVVK